MELKRNTEGTSQALKIDAFTRIHHLTVSRISKGLIPVCDYVTLIMEWDAGIQEKKNSGYTFGRNEGNHNTLSFFFPLKYQIMESTIMEVFFFSYSIEWEEITFTEEMKNRSRVMER